ncbi:MAG: 2-haloalkanoic acid dehalogenase [Burkholderiaceae bacterium]|jgi:2-haloacid dehalogenase|nr:MAG: 2-haloalkanoic acid dehalogenase [Burkholderiaceae bacterium]
MQAPQAVLFDAYGTLFDVYSVGQLAEALFPGQGAALAALWRDKQIEYTRLVTTSDDGAHYQPFWTLTGAALRFAIKKIANFEEPMPASAGFDSKIERLMDAYRRLDCFPDAKPLLEKLKARGVATGILSNGDPQMLADAVQSAGIGALLDHVISVDAVRKYKTHPEAYKLGERATGLAPQQILFVSSNSWDALGATWHGFRTLWVNRQRLPFEELGTLPTRIGTRLGDVLAFF